MTQASEMTIYVAESMIRQRVAQHGELARFDNILEPLIAAAVAAERERAVNAIKAKAEAIKFGEFRHPCNKAVINALESVASAIRDGGKNG